jgi:Pvc16 N-terminal domain
MSNALAIAGVSAVLQSFLSNSYTGTSALFGGTPTVSVKPPDIVQGAFTPGSSENQVNLFLHQVTHNQGWRNEFLPSVGADGRTQIANPPLALDLHYLLTAYGSEDWQAEALLGFALLMLHENPVLTRNDIRTAISKLPVNDPTNPLSAALISAGLADQIEMLKITPATLGREEMAWLWTALKADYRPTFPFQVSVVLIEPQKPAVSRLPVLQRDITVQPNVLSPLPAITGVFPPNGQAVANLGDTVTVQGTNLNGATGVLLINSLRQIEQTVTPLLNAGNTSFQFVPPNLNAPGELPAGIYNLAAQVPSGPDTVNTNSLPFAIAPNISAWAPGMIASGNVTLTVPCTPFLQPGQEVFLIIGDQQAAADPFTTATNSPSFTYPALQPTGGFVPARLRVDGVDSPIIDMTQTPPVFSGPKVQVT